MKLIISRHAKSSWETNLRDHDRPLNLRGIKAADKIGIWLAKNNHHPKAVLSSTSARTRSTWRGLSQHLNKPLRVNFTSAIYGGVPGDLLRCLQGEELEPLIILGHNPAISSFASAILTNPPTDLEFLRFPTLATVVCELNIPSWRECGFGQGELIDFVIPRNLL